MSFAFYANFANLFLLNYYKAFVCKIVPYAGREEAHLTGSVKWLIKKCYFSLV